MFSQSWVLEYSLKAKYHHTEKASVYKNTILSKKIPGILTDNILRDLGPLEWENLYDYIWLSI